MKASEKRSNRVVGGRNLLLCFLLGAAVGTALDGIHAYGGVLSYTDQAFGRWAWFVPVEFGLLGLGAAIVMPVIEDAVAGDATPQWSLARRAGEVVVFGALYASTVVADGHGAAPALLALALAALAVARVSFEHVPGDWFYALAAAIAGPVVESLLSAAGLFSYAHPDFAHIPIWLAPLWANGGLMLRRVLAPIALDHWPPSSRPRLRPSRGQTKRRARDRQASIWRRKLRQGTAGSVTAKHSDTSRLVAGRVEVASVCAQDDRLRCTDRLRAATS